jgi:hypothetical protein
MSGKETGVPVKDTPKAAELLRAYSVFRFLQPARLPDRLCVSCNCAVTNVNLGGHSERSALSGALWCYNCADGRMPS